MIDEETRTAILRLHAQGHGSRKISRALGIARDSVRRVIQSGSSTVPLMVRAERAEPWREQILELYARYEGHLGRVHDALTGLGAAVSYPALTAFCRRHGIGHVPPPPSATQRLLQDLGALGGIARRAHRVLEGRLLAQLHESELQEVTTAFARANGEVQRLVQRFERETQP